MTTTYDAHKYAARGDGMQDWIDAGRPPYDAKGYELDNTGWPTGKKQDGTSGETAPAAPADLGKGDEVWVSLPAEDVSASVHSSVAAGKYWLSTSEQPDQNWVISQGLEARAQGSGSSDEAHPFDLVDGPVSLHVSFNAAAVSAEQLAARKAAGQCVSKAHYKLHKVA